MADPDDEERPLTKEEEREEEIADLRSDLDHSLRMRDRYAALATMSEVRQRANDRFGNRLLPVALALIPIACMFTLLLSDLPFYVPILLAPIAIGLVYAICFLWEWLFAPQMKPAWRAAQVAEFDVEIGEIRNELFRLGVKEKDDPKSGGEVAR